MAKEFQVNINEGLGLSPSELRVCSKNTFPLHTLAQDHHLLRVIIAQEGDEARSQEKVKLTQVVAVIPPTTSSCKSKRCY
ncbi:hypothetical protein Pmani_031674 [Petrolisthes manimaculis]|uniref:Uncharacterized protein n=1 Tax=Petrolisthes manimaculis TaxID=1843537 RepID=A0AAE1TS57_9EUCA|nr:hypothetical protein Pmani_031674 [Petrolisthes manimaculis]